MSIDINEELKKIDESRNWVEFMKPAPCEKLKKLTISQLIILEYIETIINQILYYRFMYPESAFIPLKKYSLSCHFVRGDIMTDYLSTMLNQIESALKDNSLRKVKT